MFVLGLIITIYTLIQIFVVDYQMDFQVCNLGSLVFNQSNHVTSTQCNQLLSKTHRYVASLYIYTSSGKSHQTLDLIWKLTVWLSYGSLWLVLDIRNWNGDVTGTQRMFSHEAQTTLVWNVSEVNFELKHILLNTSIGLDLCFNS